MKVGGTIESSDDEDETYGDNPFTIPQQEIML
jgi:hypothetical protein